MDKTLKEKIIDSTFKGIDKIIENTYKNHPDENLIQVVEYKRDMMII